MICSSEKRFFTSNLLALGNWTPDRCATQKRGRVELFDPAIDGLGKSPSPPHALAKAEATPCICSHREPSSNHLLAMRRSGILARVSVCEPTTCESSPRIWSPANTGSRGLELPRTFPFLCKGEEIVGLIALTEYLDYRIIM